ncbi:MAG: PspC domain-containing protein [Bacteroidales bacterium]|nr:PspC domain-containing protein [Bacteroidales bacterium]
MVKKLYRSRTDRKIFGVCGGIAEYFGVDSVIIRLIFLFLTICAGCGVLAYLISWIVIPEQPAGYIDYK